MGELYMVATPIGNLGDMTFRAVDTLKSVDVVACEDTRETMKLLNHFQISKRLISVRSQNELSSVDYICELLEKGSVAYCSDAGTPCISDPGARLAGEVRKRGFKVVPIPGVSAVTAIVSISDITGKGFLFEGFLSPKGGRRKRRVEELMDGENSFILYESPFRVVKLMKDISDTDITRQVIVGRELTKSYEEIICGTSDEVLQDLSTRKVLKGEFVILVSGKKKC